jgi:outer membrane protein assembly factor BamB
MGRVFLGRIEDGPLVAIKVIHRSFAEDPVFRQRFRREVAVAATVTGPYAAALVKADPDALPPWLATEYMPGPTLADIVETAGALPEPAVRALGFGLAEALRSIHSCDIAHRDLKPSNVLVLADGPRVIDFGIAQAFHDPRYTATGLVAGSVGYLAPEQFDRTAPGPKGDVFALGAVLVLAATGHTAFETATLSEYYGAVRRGRVKLTGVPGRLVPMLRACLAPDANDRPTVADVHAFLAVGAADLTANSWLPAPALDLIVTQQTLVSELLNRAGAASPATLTRPRHRVRTRPANWRPWRVMHDAMVRNRPVVVDGGIYLGADNGLHALDAITGRSRWTCPGGGLTRWTPPPAVSGDQAYLAVAEGLCALDVATGARRWVFDTESVRSAPVVAGESVYVLAGGRSVLVAVDARTGAQRWRTPTSAGRPVVVGDTIYAAGGNRIQARDAATGRRLWTSAGLTAVPERPLVTGGRVYITAPDGLFALDAATGERCWRLQDTLVRARPAAAGDTVLLASAKGLQALDAATGSPRWTAPVLGTPMVSGSAVYLTTDAGLSAVDLATGTPRWVYECSWVHPPPVVCADTVYLLAGGQVHAVDTANGERRWTSSGVYALNPPVVGGGIVYLESGYSLSALNADTGAGPAPERLAADGYW